MCQASLGLATYETQCFVSFYNLKTVASGERLLEKSYSDSSEIKSSKAHGDCQHFSFINLWRGRYEAGIFKSRDVLFSLDRRAWSMYGYLPSNFSHFS